MSDVHIPKIKEFPDEGRVWRIDWIGAVEQNPTVPSEATVQVILSPLAGEERDPTSNLSVCNDERRTVKIGLGQFPVIIIGSLWQNGVFLNKFAGESTTLNDVVIGESTVRLVPPNFQFDEKWLIHRRYHQVGRDGLSSRCLAISYGDDPFGIIIPVAEIIRFYYAVSTDMAHAVFSGKIRHDPLNHWGR